MTAGRVPGRGRRPRRYSSRRRRRARHRRGRPVRPRRGDQGERGSSRRLPAARTDGRGWRGRHGPSRGLPDEASALVIGSGRIRTAYAPDPDRARDRRVADRARLRRPEVLSNEEPADVAEYGWSRKISTAREELRPRTSENCHEADRVHLHDDIGYYIHRSLTALTPPGPARPERGFVSQVRIRSVSVPPSGLGAASRRVAAPRRPAARRMTPSAAGIGAG